jgi:hypothetical protein
MVSKTICFKRNKLTLRQQNPTTRSFHLSVSCKCFLQVDQHSGFVLTVRFVRWARWSGTTSIPIVIEMWLFFGRMRMQRCACCLSVSWHFSRKLLIYTCSRPPRLPHFLNNRLTDGGEVVSRSLPPGGFLVFNSVRG